jgi:hypothetical protein
MMAKAWPRSRIKELTALEKLLRDVASLNTGNCVIERMQRCIKAAEKLGRSDFQAARVRPSFIRFLDELACPIETRKERP